jgi:hypothetical protein
MKKFLHIGLSAIMTLSFITPVAVLAQEATTNQTTTKPTLSEEEKKLLAERIAKRKTELKTRIATSEKTRIQGKCVAAQTPLSTVKGHVTSMEKSRANVYANVIEKFNTLSEKLKNKGVDTTEFDADIATLKTKVDTLNTDLATYKQAVTDLVAMDCKTDPEGFKASLETARASLLKLKTDSDAIKAYIKDTIKPLLVTIRAQLETDKPTTTEGQ